MMVKTMLSCHTVIFLQSLPKHKADVKVFKYPFGVYKHWFLNNWNYFTKPKLKAKIGETINAIKTRSSIH